MSYVQYKEIVFHLSLAKTIKNENNFLNEAVSLNTY
jgi:hypothetical protein